MINNDRIILKTIIVIRIVLIITITTTKIIKVTLNNKLLTIHEFLNIV
jgi:hypothetical protein